MGDLKCFCYVFSKETTEKLLSGEAVLGTGGAKTKNGQMLELGRPLVINNNEDEIFDLTSNKHNQILIHDFIRQIDLYENKIDGIQDSIWLCNAAMQQLSAISFDCFSTVIDKLNYMSDQLKRIQDTINEYHQNSRISEFWKHISNLKSDIDYMTMENFSASSSFMVLKQDIGEIMSYLTIINKEFLEGSIDGKIAISIIFSLLQPYAFVVKSFSAQFYFENGKYPMAYDDWIKVINDISKNQRFLNRMIYFARLEDSITLEQKMLACKQAGSNLRTINNEVMIDKEYALTHTKEDYDGRGQKLIAKIENGDYQIIANHLLVML